MRVAILKVKKGCPCPEKINVSDVIFFDSQEAAENQLNSVCFLATVKNYDLRVVECKIDDDRLQVKRVLIEKKSDEMKRDYFSKIMF